MQTQTLSAVQALNQLPRNNGCYEWQKASKIERPHTLELQQLLLLVDVGPALIDTSCTLLLHRVPRLTHERRCPGPWQFKYSVRVAGVGPVVLNPE